MIPSTPLRPASSITAEASGVPLKPSPESDCFVLERSSDNAQLRVYATPGQLNGAVAVWTPHYLTAVHGYWGGSSKLYGPELSMLFVTQQYRQMGYGKMALAGIYWGVKNQGHPWVHANVFPLGLNPVSTEYYMNFLSKMGFYQPFWARLIGYPKMVAPIPNPAGEQLLREVEAGCGT